MLDYARIPLKTEIAVPAENIQTGKLSEPDICLGVNGENG